MIYSVGLSLTSSRFNSLGKFLLSKSLIMATQDSNLSRGFSISANATFKWSLKYLKSEWDSLTVNLRVFLSSELFPISLGRTAKSLTSLCIWLLKELWRSFWFATRPKSSTMSFSEWRSALFVADKLNLVYKTSYINFYSAQAAPMFVCVRMCFCKRPSSNLEIYCS